MADEADNLVLQLLRSLRAELAALDAKVEGFRAEWKADLRSEINSLRADVASDMASLQSEIATHRKETREQINGLRRTVVDYHASVVGHGMLISELEERMNRVEGVLNLPPLNPH